MAASMEHAMERSIANLRGMPPVPRRARAWHSQHRLISCVHASASVVAPTSLHRQPQTRNLARELQRFLGPASVLPLAEPIMTLTNTVAIGKWSSTAQLAALGPADMLLSFTTYMCRGLHVTTQSLVGAALNRQDKQSAASFLGTCLYIALGTGSVLAGCLSLGSAWLVPALGVQNIEVAVAASEYLRIRALALPAILATMVLQSSKLAQRDSLTPCLSVALTVVVSLLANIVFVAVLGWGLKGAAVTTVGTQYLGALALLAALHHPNSQLKPDWSLPRPELLWTCVTTMAPVTAMYTAKNLCYLIAQAAAAGLSTASLATHQAAYSLWTLFTWAVAPLEQASMAFLPSLTHPRDRRVLAHLVLLSGVALGAAAGLLQAGIVCVAPGLLVQDATTQGLLGSITLQGAVALLLVGVDTTASSINIALKDYDYVARSYVVTLGVTAAYFAVCRQQGWGLAGVWWGLAVFFGMRCLQSLPRAVQSLQLWPDATAWLRSVPAPGKATDSAAGAQQQKLRVSSNVTTSAVDAAFSAKKGNNVVPLAARLAYGAGTAMQSQAAAAS